MDIETVLGGIDRDLVFQFFVKFSVIECALKRSGFLQPQEGKNARHSEAKANWKKFADHFRPNFHRVRTKGFSEAVQTLIKESPKKQIVKDKQLAWAEVDRPENVSDHEFVLLLVRTVRNNLFHGGKYSEPEAEVARNKKILEASLVVLDACIELDPDIARWAIEAA
jgi:hypothetical protein